MYPRMLCRTDINYTRTIIKRFCRSGWRITGSDNWYLRHRPAVYLGSMMSHQRVIVGLSQSAPAMGWGSPLHAWLASVNWIGGARCLNRRYRYGARGMHYHILLRQYRENCYTYNSVVKNTCSPCHKDACIKISIGNTEWLLRYKGMPQCLSGFVNHDYWVSRILCLIGSALSEIPPGCAA